MNGISYQRCIISSHNTDSQVRPTPLDFNGWHFPIKHWVLSYKYSNQNLHYLNNFKEDAFAIV